MLASRRSARDSERQIEANAPAILKESIIAQEVKKARTPRPSKETLRLARIANMRKIYLQQDENEHPNVFVPVSPELTDEDLIQWSLNLTNIVT